MRNSDYRAFYRRGLTALAASGLPYMVGGAYALGHHTGVRRETKDLDIFIRGDDAPAVLRLFHELGSQAQMVARHWLAKATWNDAVIDFVWGFRNGIGRVDDAWFPRAASGTLFHVPTPLLSIEHMIWSKAFVMERDRYDGADIAHLLRAGGPSLDWRLLLDLFGAHWPVLLSHLILYGYVFPGGPDPVPAAVRRELLDRWAGERDADPAPGDGPLCRGTLFSFTQYAFDLDRGYRDARLPPSGTLSPENLLE